MLGPGIEPGPQRWEASALNTALDIPVPLSAGIIGKLRVVPSNRQINFFKRVQDVTGELASQLWSNPLLHSTFTYISKK